MILLFLHICKTFHKIKNLDEHTLYSLMEDVCFSMAQGCPSCHAPASSFYRNGSYQRHLVCYSKGCVCDRRITVRSCLCTSCRHSHALLPSLIIPYSSFSLGFLISLLYARATRKFPSVTSLCKHFDISESTYYRIKKRFTSDSKALMDAIRTLLAALDLMTPTTFIGTLASIDPLTLHESLSLFFLSTGHSFLQPCIRLRPKLSCKNLPPGYIQIP